MGPRRTRFFGILFGKRRWANVDVTFSLQTVHNYIYNDMIHVYCLLGNGHFIYKRSYPPMHFQNHLQYAYSRMNREGTHNFV